MLPMPPMPTKEESLVESAYVVIESIYGIIEDPHKIWLHLGDTIISREATRGDLSLYSILLYNNPDIIFLLTKEEHDQVMLKCVPLFLDEQYISKNDHEGMIYNPITGEWSWL